MVAIVSRDPGGIEDQPQPFVYQNEESGVPSGQWNKGTCETPRIEM